MVNDIQKKIIIIGGGLIGELLHIMLKSKGFEINHFAKVSKIKNRTFALSPSCIDWLRSLGFPSLFFETLTEIKSMKIFDSSIKNSVTLNAEDGQKPALAYMVNEKNFNEAIKKTLNSETNFKKLSNDFGDTGEGGKGPDNEPNKPQFWRNADGIELPIRLSNVPTKNLVVTADRQGACPEPDQKETCYGGNIYIKESNTFNPFNYSFNYQVYDADGAISNTATVSVISTATTTDDTRNASNNGGGSIGVFSIFGLMGLLAYRRFRK